jgi:hypothetical protein
MDAELCRLKRADPSRHEADASVVKSPIAVQITQMAHTLTQTRISQSALGVSRLSLRERALTSGFE